jgi:ketosteroid isomerase-like protein
MTGNKDLLERVVTLYNAGDLRGLVELYAEDADMVTPDGAYKGRAAIGDYWRWVNASFPDCILILGVTVEQGDAVAFEYTWAGTNTGPLVLPDGTHLPPTGKRVETRCMDLLQVRYGKIAVHHLHWDNLELAAQLGLPPRS